ncbi:MAG: UxaA family hydrolase [Anaerococcus prevotii]|uniref:UxaA family hydrolase n=1 Tax=Anaerococcus prevotii TaxID=33034 RepID=UPI0028FE7C04|nr:UxaA family hydrolase [Anaerococcus prevotii]MDU2558336.1 UxaA family hydrolase [Anaerococcus prevotii]
MTRTFWGYKRSDGRVGIRNHILILPCSVCASDTTRIIAGQVKEAVTFNMQLGCSQVGKDFEYTLNTISGFAANPNIYATVLVSLGCENAQLNLVKKEIEKRTNKPIKSVIIQEEGGTLKAIEKATRYAKEFSAEASTLRREEFPVSELIMGTECGGSDPTSGLASNVLIGKLSDKMVENGGTTVLSETTEFIGAEHILARRAKNEDVRRRIYDIIHRYEKHIHDNTGHEVRDGNPSPGNKEGGLSTLEEKSLGCIHKGGSTNINAVYDYSNQLKAGEGLVIMDTPGNDPSSVAGMIAGGCQIVVFSTGRGTPTGNPIAPVVKITGNRETSKTMADNLDWDASPIIYGEKTLDELSDEYFYELIEFCNGKLTKAEALGYTELAIQRGANFV